MGFINNYLAWVIGPIVEENIQIIQGKIIPILKKQKRTSRAQFKVKKTSFIHLIKYKEVDRNATIPL